MKIYVPKCDNNGVPINIVMAGANMNDAKIAKFQIIKDSLFVDTESFKVKNNNRFKQSLLGDSGYHSSFIYTALKKRHIKPITDVNFRNTRNEEKIKELENQKKEYLKICKKRAIVENSYAWLKKYPKMNIVIEKTAKSYMGLVLLAYSLVVNNKLG